MGCVQTGQGVACDITPQARQLTTIQLQAQAQPQPQLVVRHAFSKIARVMQRALIATALIDIIDP